MTRGQAIIKLLNDRLCGEWVHNEDEIDSLGNPLPLDILIKRWMDFPNGYWESRRILIKNIDKSTDLVDNSSIDKITG